jgi:ribosome biogenesis protein ERB1
VQQRFNRCLDLYLAPRAHRKNKILTDEDVEDLKPKLPPPSELRPFPIACAVTYAHPDGVRTRCLSFDPTGVWLVTGADDGAVRLWEVKTGRCARTWQIGARGNPITAVEWSPSADRAFFVVARCVLPQTGEELS